MIHVSGSNLYGRVDDLRGVAYLATVFDHQMMFPLSPTQCYLVIRRPGVGGFFKVRTEWAGHAIPSLLWRSVFAAWARGIAFLYLLWQLFALMIVAGGGDPVRYDRLAIAGAIFAAAWATRYLPASFRRAVMLLRLADAPDEVARAVERAYGRKISEQWPGRFAAAADE